MIEMKRCPTCGSWLTAKLIAAIENPFTSESCPKAQPVTPPVKKLSRREKKNAH